MITRLLVANRGEIARRIFRTCRAMGIETVAVFSDADQDLPFVRDAGVAVRLPGSSSADTYLRGDLVIAAAVRCGADAIHPGYGFLSENAAFARAVLAAGIVWVGPPPDAIEAMGDKLRAKELMRAAGVPVLGSEGFPAIVKASAGGGGRGMRIVRDASGLDDAMAAASREALAAFGDGTVFVERYLEGPRHIEVQLMADRFGNVEALFERDCSVQRRHQKVIEEAPSPFVSTELRSRLCDAAVTAAQAVSYEGAGTVEFVVSAEGEPFFLEMNTRLQVEHPVTEEITGLDLVRLQLQVAAGESLGELEPLIVGHAVEARLYAEDVPAGYLPVTGASSRVRWPDVDGVHVDSGVESGSVVGIHYDAMLAKVIAWGHDRDEACRRLVAALAGAHLHGLVTNRDLLVRVLSHPDFRDGGVDTGWLERQDPAVIGAPRLSGEDLELTALAAAEALAARRRSSAVVQTTAPSGWRNIRSAPQVTVLSSLAGEVSVSRPAAGVLSAGPDLVVLERDGLRRSFFVHLDGPVAHVDSSLGSMSFVEVDPLPAPADAAVEGSLQAPMPGTVLSVSCGPGDAVVAGQTLVVLEAMKMEHAVRAATDGTVESVHVEAGQQVEAEAVLVVVEVR